MNWYYAAAGKQQGPVTTAELEALYQAGTITADSLVWTEGLPTWIPLGQVQPPPFVLGREPRGQAEAAGAQAGAAPFAQSMTDPTAMGDTLLESGDTVDIGEALACGWGLVKNNLGLSMGVTLLMGIIVALLAGLSKLVPIVGDLVNFLFLGPLTGGFYWFYLQIKRGRPVELSDAFAGFRRQFGPLLLSGLLYNLVSSLFLVPGLICLDRYAKGDTSMLVPMVILLLMGLLPSLFAQVCFGFAIPLVIDKRLPVLAAFKLSLRVVLRQWLPVFGLFAISGLVGAGGFLVCCVGMFVTIPLMMASIACGYEQLFGRFTSPE